jgi:hypothetical protein
MPMPSLFTTSRAAHSTVEVYALSRIRKPEVRVAINMPAIMYGTFVCQHGEREW